jgi:hypothetical protein
MKSNTGGMLIALLMLWLLAGCSSDPYAKYQRHFDKALQEVIESGTKSVPVKKLTSFDWAEVCVALPYGATGVPGVSEEMIQKNVPWALSKSYWGLLFFSPDRRLVAALKVDGHLASYAENTENALCLKRDKANAVILYEKIIRLKITSEVSKP